ncbi:MAG: hypothetical protein EOP08_10600, partial [Proteobacteria bacterium]
MSFRPLLASWVLLGTVGCKESPTDSTPSAEGAGAVGSRAPSRADSAAPGGSSAAAPLPQPPAPPPAAGVAAGLPAATFFTLLGTTDQLAWLFVYPYEDLRVAVETRKPSPPSYSIVVELENGCVRESYPGVGSSKELDRPEAVTALRSSIGLAHRFGLRRLDGLVGTATWSADFGHVIAESKASLMHSRDGGLSYLPLDAQASVRTHYELVDGDRTLLYGRCAQPPGDAGSRCRQFELVSRSLEADDAEATVLRPLPHAESFLAVAPDGQVLIAETEDDMHCLGRFDRKTRTTKTVCPSMKTYSMSSFSPSGRYRSGSWQDAKGVHEGVFDMFEEGKLLVTVPSGLGVEHVDDAG